MRLFLVLAFSMLLALPSFSQSTKCHRYVPYFRSLKPEKLALRLTRNLDSDSAKVDAIHCWITHHIKYDVKKYLAFNYTRIPLKKILRRRKAICTGYSDLFNALCKYANVKSTGVPGYAKNQTVDLNDKFYIDEHIWNAVYIDSGWRLVDACWDAGYIKYFRRTFFGFFVHTFTLGANDILKYKPHFVFAPSKAYFYKSGYYFITDHLPSDPVWQLMDPIQTVVQAEKDSAFYFWKYDDTWTPLFSDAMDRERLELLAMDEKERDIADGFSAYKYNHKNHYGIGNSFRILAVDEYNKIDPKTSDTLGLLIRCDSVDGKFKNAIMHYDSNVYFLGVQRSELAANNEKKRSIMEAQNGRLIASTKVALRNVKKGNYLGSLGKKLTKSIEKINGIRLKRLNKNPRFSKTKRAKKSKFKDSLISLGKIDSLFGVLDGINPGIEKRFRHLDSLYGRYMALIRQYSQLSGGNRSTGVGLCIIRLFYEDDLDYFLRQVKDTLMGHKFRDDSLLIEPETGFIIRHFYKEFVKVKNDFNDLYKCHKALALEYSKLKGACVGENDLGRKYRDNLKRYAAELAAYSILINNYKVKFNEIRRVCKRQKKPTGKELKQYKKEKSIELHLFNVRNTYINRHNSSLVRMSNKQKKKCEKVKARIQNIRKKYKG